MLGCAYILEDDEQLAETMAELLAGSYKVKVFSTVCEFTNSFAENFRDVALVVADLKLPDGFFSEFLLKESSLGVPILVVSHYDEQAVINECLELGAVDYLTKPFNPNELLIKAKRVARRNHQPILDPYAITVSYNGKTSPRLTRTEYDIVRSLLSSDKGRLSREDLVQAVWGSFRLTAKNLNVHLTHLRRKLRQIGWGIRFNAHRYCLEEVGKVQLLREERRGTQTSV